MNGRKARVLLGTLITTAMLTGLTTAHAQSNNAGDAAESRVSITTQMKRIEREQGSAGTVTRDEFAALSNNAGDGVLKGPRGPSKSGEGESRSPSNDFWIYSADVILFNDNDGDGFYHGIDLLFDADTYYESAEVYAVVYLSLEGGPWEELAVTENFLIFGASADDEYVVVSELVSGYPTGSYDLLIELFDTWDNAFVASYGPVDTSELAFLQLEDAGRDAAPGTTVIVREGGGGALGVLPLLPLLLVAGRRATRRLLAELREERA